jgi:hypothetical protein
MSIYIHPDIRIRIARDLQSERIARAQNSIRQADALRTGEGRAPRLRGPLLDRLRRLEAR